MLFLIDKFGIFNLTSSCYESAIWFFIIACEPFLNNMFARFAKELNSYSLFPLSIIRILHVKLFTNAMIIVANIIIVYFVAGIFSGRNVEHFIKFISVIIPVFVLIQSIGCIRSVSAQMKLIKRYSAFSFFNIAWMILIIIIFKSINNSFRRSSNAFIFYVVFMLIVFTISLFLFKYSNTILLKHRYQMLGDE